MIDDLSPPALMSPLAPNLEKYRALLKGIELTEEQANSILMEVWAFAFRCVEAHFAPPPIPDIFAALLLQSSEFDADVVQCSKEFRSEDLTYAGSDNGCE